MTCLFFSLSFVNAIVDSTKDTLVITAKRGGAELVGQIRTDKSRVCASNYIFKIWFETIRARFPFGADSLFDRLCRSPS